tara:strand:- start:72 stop:545 length:474 start_codon:yes stop_codon:yes gene_type:complete
MIQVGAYEIALIGIGGAVIGALLGAWVAYRLTVQLTKSGEKRQSAYRLHMAFKNELLALNPSESIIEGSLCAFLKSAFEKHHEAVYEYSFFLKGKEKINFIKAWHNYIRHDAHVEHGINLVHFEKYSTVGLSLGQKPKIQKKAQVNIEDILSYANFN